MKYLLGYLEFHDILTNKQQRGFRSGHSSENQRLITTHGLLTSADLGESVNMAIPVHDLSQAFDMVPHRRLMSKSDFYGIRSNTPVHVHGFPLFNDQKTVCCH